MSKTKKMIMFSGVMLLVLIFSGCGLADYAERKTGEEIVERSIEAQTGGKVDIDSQKDGMTIKSGEGEFNISGSGQAALHKDFPQDIYIASDAQVILSMANNENKNFSVAYVTGMTMEETNAKYKEELIKNGWISDDKAEMVFGQARTMLYKKGDIKLTVMIALSEDSQFAGKTHVQVIGAKDSAGN